MRPAPNNNVMSMAEGLEEAGSTVRTHTSSEAADLTKDEWITEWALSGSQPRSSSGQVACRTPPPGHGRPLAHQLLALAPLDRESEPLHTARQHTQKASPTLQGEAKSFPKSNKSKKR